MGAWVCESCGLHTDQPQVVCDNREFWGFPAFERFYYCPRCGESIAFDEEAKLEDAE